MEDKKIELEKRLDNELKNIFKEHETMHISSARHLAVKNLGLKEVNPYTKKGYIEPKNCLKWGSKAGYDIEIFVSLFEG